jgi:hypothetical protein
MKASKPTITDGSVGSLRYGKGNEQDMLYCLGKNVGHEIIRFKSDGTARNSREFQQV